MTFYNLDKQQVVEYQLNIAESFNDIQRFDLDIPEIPNLYFEVYADVYDNEWQPVEDRLLFISYYSDDFLMDALSKIRALREPYVEGYTRRSERSMLEHLPDSPFTKLVLEGRKRTGNFPQNIDLDMVGKNLKRLLPMTFFNLEQNKEVGYYVDIAKGFKYIKRFDLVYDGENKVTDTLIFVSFNNETNIIKVRRQINNLRTPEIHKYREEREKSLIRYVLENKIIEKVIEREYGGKS